MAARVPAGLTATEGRRFGLTLAIAFGALGGLFWWRDAGTPMVVVAALSGVFLLGGLLVPTKLGPVERAWMAMAHAISKITTPIVMGIVYYGVVTPIGLVMRVVKRNPLVHPASGSGFWHARANEQSNPEGMRHLF